MRYRIIAALSAVFMIAAASGCAFAQNPQEASSVSWDREIVDQYGIVGKNPHACIGSDNRLHISYYNDSGQLKYATKLVTGKSWSDYVIESDSGTGTHNCIAVNSTMVFVAYHNESTGSLMLWTKKIVGLEKPKKIVVDNSSHCGQFCKIAVDKLGGVHIVYQDFSMLRPKYAHLPAAGFGTFKVLATSGGSGFGIAVDKENGLHVAINDLSKMILLYAYKKHGYDWKNVTIDSDSKGGCMLSVAVDGSNATHVSYYDQENKQLKYAIITEGALHGFLADKGVVDDAGDTGWHTSICYDSGGGIHISYMDYTNNHTKYAYKPSGSSVWQTETVDGTSLTGEGTAIVCDSQDKLHIIYYDQGNTNLMMASGKNIPVDEPAFAVAIGFIAMAVVLLAILWRKRGT